MPQITCDNDVVQNITYRIHISNHIRLGSIDRSISNEGWVIARSRTCCNPNYSLICRIESNPKHDDPNCLSRRNIVIACNSITAWALCVIRTFSDLTCTPLRTRAKEREPLPYFVKMPFITYRIISLNSLLECPTDRFHYSKFHPVLVDGTLDRQEDVLSVIPVRVPDRFDPIKVHIHDNF